MLWRRFTCAFVLSLTLASPAWADDAAARSVERANTGLSLYEQGKWEEALQAFREAEAQYHSPVYLLYTARTLGRAGRWKAARQAYDRILNEALPSDAPDAWRKARAEARSEREALERGMPTAVVEVRGGSGKTRITVDGAPMSAGVPIALDPGTHVIAASDGDRHVTRDVLLQEGRKRARVVLALPAEQERAMSVPGLVLTGVGGAALLAGGVVGLVALNKASTAREGFPDSCDGNTCPASRRAEIETRTESARTFGSVSNGLFIGGGLVLAAGVVLLLVDPGAKPNASTALRF